MLFNSLHYAIFFPIVLWLYFLLPEHHRWKILLVASCYFYMAFVPSFILILALLIAVDYTAGLLLDAPLRPHREWVLAMSIAANLGILFTYKYYGFFAGTVNSVLTFIGLAPLIPAYSVILPIGLSFHTFQSLSYTIEVYRGTWRAERHLGLYSLYVLFFPQMVAGPIERPANLLPQLRASHTFSLADMRLGMHLIAVGLFKKMLLADNFALYVDEFYSRPHEFPWLSAIAALVFFSLQIYFDFSGYSDIALGSARCLGIDLMVNFRAPYLAGTLADFWRRWHISLSSWFRDYVYIPLGGNRVRRARHSANILIVFFLSGLWHGANWTFAIWGLLHGIGLMLESALHRALRRPFGAVAPAITIALTFCFVTMSWIFFRAPSLSVAADILCRVLTGWTEPHAFRFVPVPGLFRGDALILMVLSIAVVAAEAVWTAPPLWRILQIESRPLRWSLYYAAAVTVLILGVFESRQFIYFQF